MPGTNGAPPFGLPGFRFPVSSFPLAVCTVESHHVLVAHRLLDELLGIVTALDRAGVPYAVCGALALAAYGAPRATNDIDLLANPSDEQKIREAANSCGFVFEALPMTFSSSGISIKRFTKIVETRPLMLDVLWVNDALAPIFADRQTHQIDGKPMSVVSRDGLIVLKTTAGRPQDLVDIQKLMEVGRGG